LILKVFLRYVKDNSSRLFLTPFYSPPMSFAGTSAGTFHHVGRLATIENEVEVKPPPPTKRVRFVDIEKLNSALISAPIPAAAQGRKDEAGGRRPERHRPWPSWYKVLVGLSGTGQHSPLQDDPRGKTAKDIFRFHRKVL
jgi:hypothetical protein